MILIFRSPMALWALGIILLVVLNIIMDLWPGGLGLKAAGPHYVWR